MPAAGDHGPARSYTPRLEDMAGTCSVPRPPDTRPRAGPSAPSVPPHNPVQPSAVVNTLQVLMVSEPGQGTRYLLSHGPRYPSSGAAPHQMECSHSLHPHPPRLPRRASFTRAAFSEAGGRPVRRELCYRRRHHVASVSELNKARRKRRVWCTSAARQEPAGPTEAHLNGDRQWPHGPGPPEGPLSLWGRT